MTMRIMIDDDDIDVCSVKKYHHHYIHRVALCARVLSAARVGEWRVHRVRVAVGFPGCCGTFYAFTPSCARPKVLHFYGLIRPKLLHCPHFFAGALRAH